MVSAAEGAATPRSIAVVINPISGTGGRIDVARARAAQAAAFLASRGCDPSNVFITERPGHAREIALAAIDRGVSTVAAWGGDGTMNEVGTALAFKDAALALVPSGSGNGLARDLGIPFDAAAALDVAFSGRERVIDAGDIDGRLFFNVAGIGLDARVAHRFAVDGLEKRGFSRYMAITLRELARYQPDRLTVTTPAASTTGLLLLVAIANGRQYGNGAMIAPHARLDDGRLDVVTVTTRPLVRACLELPLVFMGKIDRLGGVTMATTESVQITSPHPVVYHLDGEPIAGTLGIAARACPRALTILVPTS
jgi:YegS/Rv2252/BmrU family lipid kinase